MGGRGAGRQVGFCSPNSQEMPTEEQEEKKDADGKGNDHLVSSVQGRVISRLNYQNKTDAGR